MPNSAGRLLSSAPAIEVDKAQVADVAKELACLCGSCPTRPLDECRCGYAGQQRDRIGREIEAGRSKDVILAGFVAEFGERIFVTPPKEGFNLLAWFMPFFGILLGAVLVRSVIRRGMRHSPETGPAAADTMISDADRARLDEALREEER